MVTIRAAMLGLAGFGALALAADSGAAAEPIRVDISRAYPGESYSQYRRRYYARPYGYYRGRPYYYRRDYGTGAAAAGAAAGLAAGALLGSAIASQAQPAPRPLIENPDYIAYCARKYRSFDPVDGTFLARNGRRYPCEGPF